jgi:hypothetical protein
MDRTVAACAPGGKGLAFCDILLQMSQYASQETSL